MNEAIIASNKIDAVKRALRHAEQALTRGLRNEERAYRAQQIEKIYDIIEEFPVVATELHDSLMAPLASLRAELKRIEEASR